MLLLYLRMQAS